MNTNIRSKKAGETRNVSVDFSGKLATGELLTGAPTVAEVTTSDLTISDIDLNDDVQDNYRSFFAPVNHAVMFLVSGGTVGTVYAIRITAETSEGQTLIQDISLRVN